MILYSSVGSIFNFSASVTADVVHGLATTFEVQPAQFAMTEEKLQISATLILISTQCFCLLIFYV